MFRKEEIPTDFNGIIIIDQDKFFFDVNNNILRIFYNEQGVHTAREFREKYSEILNTYYLYGECSDKRRVVFILEQENYSSYPASYSEFQISACIKEIYYTLNGEFSNIKEKYNAKLDTLDSIDEIRISGDIVNSIYPQYDSIIDFENLPFNNVLEKPTALNPVIVNLTDNITCTFSTMRELDQKIANGNLYNTKFSFAFNSSQHIKDIFKLYYVIKRFVDFLSLARNTVFNFHLVRNYNEEKIEYAQVKVYNNYNNICNKNCSHVIYLGDIEKQIPKIFENLNKESKYTLFFLLIDNNDYNCIGYSNIQNLLTAVELACDLDKTWEKLCKSKPKGNNTLSKGQIIFNWCRKYSDIISKHQHQNKGWLEPDHYELTAEKINQFRKVRNDITHRAHGKLDIEIANCYIALESILYFHIMELDSKSWCYVFNYIFRMI